MHVICETASNAFSRFLSEAFIIYDDSLCWSLTTSPEEDISLLRTRNHFFHLLIKYLNS